MSPLHLLLLLIISLFIGDTFVSLTPLFTSRRSTEIKVTFSNAQLSGMRFWTLFIYFIVSSILSRLFLRLRVTKSFSSILIKHKNKNNDEENKDEYRLPEYICQSTISMPFSITPSNLSLYQQASSSSSRSSSSSSSEGTSLHTDSLHLQLLLSALTEPAMLILLATRQSPIDPIGSVNVRNEFHIPNFRLTHEFLSRAITHPNQNKEEMVIRARFNQRVVKVKRGLEFSIIVSLLNMKGSAPTEELFKQVFTMLQFTNTNDPPSITTTTTRISTTAPATATATATAEPSVDNPTLDQNTTKCHLSSSDPRLWAKLSKDHNPIHLYSFAAKLFGFRAKIAHGNHVVAKALSLSAQHSRMNKEESDRNGKSSWMSVEFKRPTFVPCSLDVVSTNDGIEIREKGKTNVTVRHGSI